MKTYKEIEDAIASNDISKMRDAVASLVYVDMDFSRGVMDEQIKYIESKGIKLKEDSLSDAHIISKTKDTFTDDDFAQAVLNLRRNFCDERIEDLKIISRAVNGETPTEPETVSNPKPAPTPAPSSTYTSSSTSQSHGGSSEGSGFAPLVIIAAAIAAIVALISSFRK